MLHQIKAPQFYTDLGLKNSVNGKIQGLFKAFEYFSSTVKANSFSRTLQDGPVYSNTFQACANPVDILRLRMFQINGEYIRFWTEGVFSISHIERYVLGTSKNYLIETILLCTNNISLDGKYWTQGP